MRQAFVLAPGDERMGLELARLAEAAGAWKGLVTAYREAIEACGIDTEPWWDRQLALCLLGALVQFGWEKAFGGYDEELAWWETKSVQAAALLS